MTARPGGVPPVGDDVLHAFRHSSRIFRGDCNAVDDFRGHFCAGQRPIRRLAPIVRLFLDRCVLNRRRRSRRRPCCRAQRTSSLLRAADSSACILMALASSFSVMFSTLARPRQIDVDDRAHLRRDIGHDQDAIGKIDRLVDIGRDEESRAPEFLVEIGDSIPASARLVMASRPRNGSSRIMTFGLLIIERAARRAAACRPTAATDIFCGSAARPTFCSSNSANSRISGVSSPRARGPNMMLS